jgi:hypothetical protein
MGKLNSGGACHNTKQSQDRDAVDGNHHLPPPPQKGREIRPGGPPPIQVQEGQGAPFEKSAFSRMDNGFNPSQKFFESDCTMSIHIKFDVVSVQPCGIPHKEHQFSFIDFPERSL